MQGMHSTIPLIHKMEEIQIFSITILGGRLINSFGANGMFFAALLLVVAGTVVINISIGKTDNSITKKAMD